MDKIKITAVVIDLKPIIDQYTRYGDMFPLYRKHPLRSIITRLLSIVDEELESFVGKLIFDSTYCLNIVYEPLKLELFFDGLINDIESHMYRQSELLPVTELIFDEWVDQTTVIMRIE